MLNDTYTRQKQELDNLRRRNEDLLNQVHRVESASHHISEQLATATSTVERLRHETATLKAEKEIWKVCLFVFLFVSGFIILCRRR